LADRWPGAEVIGVDSSPTMLAEARRVHPELALVEGDAASWEPPRPVDVLFSNAVLHWVPDHAALCPRLLGHTAPGGLLAVQVPDMWDAPSHRHAFELARSPRWRNQVGDALDDHPLLTPEGYLDVLEPLAEEVEVWSSTTYLALEGDHPVVEWFKGSLLRAFLSRLDPADGDDFVAEYTKRVAADYPPRPDGRTILPFQRLFILAHQRG
jgi:trans-aconitate 2-methyltransferase